MITLLLYPRFEPSVEVKIHQMKELDGKDTEGWWNMDNNYVFLSTRLYFQFLKIEKQTEKYEFFQKYLKKYSNTQLC